MEMYLTFSQLSFYEIAGLAAGFVNLSATLLYVISIGEGTSKTHPERATWFIWLIASSLLTYTYYRSGAYETLFLPIALTLEYLIVFVLSIKYGVGGWTTRDILCLIGAFIGLGIWSTYDSPELGLYAFIAVDAFGAYPTLIKSWRHPRTEAVTPWLLTVIASAVNLLAINWDMVRFSLENFAQSSFAIAAYPLYLFAINFTILFGLILRRIKLVIPANT